MERVPRLGPTRLGIVLLIALVAAFGFLMGSSLASAQTRAHPSKSSSGSSSSATGSSSSAALPCRLGGDDCINIGFTEAWLNGGTIDLEYSHDFFCAQPPSSGATSQCEAGADAQVNPPSGPIVSPIRTVTPQGFSPPSSTLQCPVPGQCIDHPHTIDLSRLMGDTNAILPAHSHVLEDDEAFQSTWWPVIVVGVKNIDAWNQIVAGKSETTVQACQAAGNCTADIPTNAFLFFQVLGPGMSPQGPG